MAISRRQLNRATLARQSLLYREKTPHDWEGLAAEAGSLVGFLAERDPTVYRRYGRWWDSIDAAEIRLLDG